MSEELKACCETPDRSLTYSGDTNVLWFCHSCGARSVVELKDEKRAEQQEGE